MNDEGLEAWALRLIEREKRGAWGSLKCFCAKPQSAKRLHRARKNLARLLATLDDFAGAIATDADLRRCVDKLHHRAGKIRDADVLFKRAKSYKERAAGVERNELKIVAKALRKRRRKACRALQSLIGRMPDVLA